MKEYYEEATMVKFLDPNAIEEEEIWLAGIAYHDEIICGRCGGTYEIKELMEEYSAEALKFEELPWIDIVDEIIGD